MGSAKRTAILSQNLSTAFFLSKLLGLIQISYNERTARFEESIFLSKYSRLFRVVWCFMPFWIVLEFELILANTTSNEKEFNSEVQRRSLCLLNAIESWSAVMAMYCLNGRNTASLLNVLNATVKSNRLLTKRLNIDTLPRPRFHTFTVIRILTSFVDIFLIHNRPKILYELILEVEPVIIWHRLVLMATFFEWHFVQTYLTAAVDALNESLTREGCSLETRDYHSLSRLYTQLFHLQQATCSYYQPFALATCASLLRTVVMALHTFQALFFTKLKTSPLESTVFTFQVFMVPGLMTALDFMMICIMAESLSKSADSYRRTFLMQSLKTQGDESSQRTIEMILRQSCWEKLSWVLVTGHSISRSTCFVVLDAAVSLTVAFLIYDGGYSMQGRFLHMYQNILQRWQYYVIVVLTILGSLVCNRVIAWCMINETHKL